MTSRRPSDRAPGWLSAEMRHPIPPSPRQEPGPPAAAHSDRARLEYEAGLAALAKGQLAIASSHFTVARGFAGPDPVFVAEVLAAQGRVLLAQESFSAAGEAFRESLAHNPANLEAHVGLAELAIATYRPAEAISPLYEALPLTTDSKRRAALHLLLAQAHSRAGRRQLARLHLKAAARLGRVNPIAAARLFASTIALWQWAIIGALALGVAFVLAPPALDPFRFAGVALLALVAIALVVLGWHWWRTPL